MAQAALLLATVGAIAIVGPPRTMFAREIVEVFTRTNLWLMLCNLLPFPPLDGAEAWKIVGELRHSMGLGQACSAGADRRSRTISRPKKLAALPKPSKTRSRGAEPKPKLLRPR